MTLDIIPGTVWRHYKGRDYVIVALAKMERDQTDVVVYRSPGGFEVWVRPYGEFLEKFRPVATEPL